MAEIVATYSPCCGIFRVGDVEQGVMHCALPHDKKVVKLVDEKELEILKILEEEIRADGSLIRIWCRVQIPPSLPK